VDGKQDGVAKLRYPVRNRCPGWLRRFCWLCRGRLRRESEDGIVCRSTSGEDSSDQQPCHGWSDLGASRLHDDAPVSVPPRAAQLPRARTPGGGGAASILDPCGWRARACMGFSPCEAVSWAVGGSNPGHGRPGCPRQAPDGGESTFGPLLAGQGVVEPAPGRIAQRPETEISLIVVPGPLPLRLAMR